MLPIRDRPLDPIEVERMRLLLSTFRDGSGQRVAAGYMPDYLAFERVTAYVCGGTTAENKGIFDVLVPAEFGQLPFGVSCKMTATQPTGSRCWFMELSNSAKKFHDAFERAGVHWTNEPEKAGPVMVDLVESWHHAVAGEVDLAGSKYLLCTHDKHWVNFEIAAFGLSLSVADPRTDIEWVAEGRTVISSIAGYIDIGTGKPHRLWQFFGNSGGQLKYYPPVGWEEWRSGTFQLEEPPVHDMAQKVEDYWPGAWPT